MANNSKEYNKKNYKKYWWKPSQIKDRTARNKARNEAEKAWKVSKGDWKEVDHKKPLAKWGSRSTKNTRVVSRKTNRKAWAAIANKRKGSWYKIKKTTKKK